MVVCICYVYNSYHIKFKRLFCVYSDSIFFLLYNELIVIMQHLELYILWIGIEIVMQKLFLIKSVLRNMVNKTNVAFLEQTYNFPCHQYFRMQAITMNAKHNVFFYYVIIKLLTATAALFFFFFWYNDRNFIFLFDWTFSRIS